MTSIEPIECLGRPVMKNRVVLAKFRTVRAKFMRRDYAQKTADSQMGSAVELRHGENEMKTAGAGPLPYL